MKEWRWLLGIGSPDVVILVLVEIDESELWGICRWWFQRARSGEENC